jgi:hypothetical protein
MSLVALPSEQCPDCGPQLVVVSWAEDALVRGCGYGETRRTTIKKCGDCGLEISRAETSERPCA